MVSDAMPVCSANLRLRQAKRLNPLANLIGREQLQMLSQALCNLRVRSGVEVDRTASVTPVYSQLADVKAVQTSVVLDLCIVGDHRRPNLTLAAMGDMHAESAAASFLYAWSLDSCYAS